MNSSALDAEGEEAAEEAEDVLSVNMIIDWRKRTQIALQEVSNRLFCHVFLAKLHELYGVVTELQKLKGITWRY